MMKLYGSLASPYVARVLLVAATRSSTCRSRCRPGNQVAAYLDESFGKMPTSSTATATYQSEVICEYLDELYPENSILRRRPGARARPVVSRVVDLYVGPESSALFSHLNPAPQRSVVEATKVKLPVAAHPRRADGASPWARAFSLADCTLIPASWPCRGRSSRCWESPTRPAPARTSLRVATVMATR